MKRNQLVVNKGEIAKNGWDCLDVVLVTGDTNVDHSSFPANLIGRWLLEFGFRVGIISRPDVDDISDIKKLGLPRLFFGVTSGAIDSMVANYTAQRRRRSDDPYSADGKAGGRPDRALTVYCNLIRRAYGKRAFIVAGGLEAGLRRFAHYDYWSDSIRRPILMDCGADVLVHGMGEFPILNIAKALRTELKSNNKHDLAVQQKRPLDSKPLVAAIKDIDGLAYRLPKSVEQNSDCLELPSTEEVQKEPEKYAQSFQLVERNRDKCISQICAGMRVIVNPAHKPYDSDQLDKIYNLPFSRNKHPMYGNNRIPALEQVRFSITSHRGCFGGCAFCAIGANQGKVIQSRSEKSIMRELEEIVSHKDFKGTVADLGGPTANMYGMSCKKAKPCKRPSCLWPSRCEHLDSNHGSYLKLLTKAARHEKVKNLFVTTGIRLDLALLSKQFIETVASKHTSGHLKIAPEHISKNVLRLMRKPQCNEFKQFVDVHKKYSKKAGKKQYVVPYLMAAHPGSTMYDMLELALFLKKENIRVEQCQIFTPTPGTASTVMYSTGLNPADMSQVFVEKDPKMKDLQKALILYHLPGNAAKVREALKLCNKSELAPLLLAGSYIKKNKYSKPKAGNFNKFKQKKK